MYFEVKPRVIGWAAAAGCALAVAVAAPSGTAIDWCGTTVTGDLTLDQDLTCTGDGLIVGADGVRIDLAGHTISGGGTGAGVRIVGRQGVWVTGGQITNFTAGVLVNNSSGVVIKHMTLSGNGEGVDLQAAARGTTIKENAFYDNRSRGVMMRGNSVDNEVKENSFAGNNVGVALNGTLRATVKENMILSGRAAGVRVNVPASGNLVAENTIAGNPSGIDFPLTGGAWAVDNAFTENRISNNTCGITGSTDGNRFSENMFMLNGADICP